MKHKLFYKDNLQYFLRDVFQNVYVSLPSAYNLSSESYTLRRR